VRDEVAEFCRVWTDDIESRPCHRKFGIPRKAPDAALEGEDLMDRHDKEKGASVQPLPGLEVGSVRRVAFPCHLVSSELILNRTRPDGRSCTGLPPESVEG
jgi:hypothetical protein